METLSLLIALVIALGTILGYMIGVKVGAKKGEAHGRFLAEQDFAKRNGVLKKVGWGTKVIPTKKGTRP